MEEEKKESGGEQKVTDDGRHPQLDGIQKVTDEKVNALIDKVIEKIVRVEVSDGRIFLGILKSVDKTKTHKKTCQLYNTKQQIKHCTGVEKG